MRDLLLMSVVGFLCLLGLLIPRVGLYGYLWFSLMRPDVLAWSYGENRYSLLLAICTLVGSAAHVPRRLHLLFTNPFVLVLLLFTGVVTVSSFTALDPSLSKDPLQLFLKVVLMSILIPILIRDFKDFRILILVVAGSIGLVSFKYGFYGLRHGGAKFLEGYGGFLSDNNTMAMAFAMAIPMLWFCKQLFRPVWIQAIFVVMVLGSVAAVIMTHSRGAALALGAGLVAIFLRSRRKLMVLLVLVAISAPAVYLVWDTYSSRLATLKDPTSEGSALSRILLARAALRIIRDYPLLGVGFGQENERRIVYKYLDPVPGVCEDCVIHNTYLQLAVDTGLPSLALYLSLLAGAFWWLWRFIKRYRDVHPEQAGLAMALEVTLVNFVVAALFLSREALDYYYIVLMSVATLYQLEKDGMLLQGTSQMGIARRESITGAPVRAALSGAEPTPTYPDAHQVPASFGAAADAAWGSSTSASVSGTARERRSWLKTHGRPPQA